MSQNNASETSAEPVPPSRQWTRSPAVEPGSPAFKFLTEQAAIAPGIIEAASKTDALREGPAGTAWFPQRNADGAITGVTLNGPEINTMMLRGSHKSLFRLPGGEDPQRLVLTEQPLEALAFAQIERMRPDTLYLATGGSFSTGSSDALRAELTKLTEKPNAELAIATGRGTSGELVAEYARRLVADIGSETLTTTRYRPPELAFNWHYYLKDHPNADPGVISPTAPTIKDAMSAAQNRETVTATAAQPETTAKIPTKDPLTDLLEQLKQAAATSNHADMEKIRQRIEQMMLEAQQNTGVLQDPVYRMRVGWSLMDVEKLTGSNMTLAEDLRNELAKRATTMPGLNNNEMGTLLGATKNLPEQKLVEDIRGAAKFVSSQPDPQMTTEINARLAGLKDRVVDAVVNMGSNTSKSETDAASTRQTAQTTQQTAQTTQQTAQTTQQTANEISQKVGQADEKLDQTGAKTAQSQTAAQAAQQQKSEGLAQAKVGTPEVIAPVRKSGDFLKTLNDIAMTWHDFTYGPNSAHAKRAAAKAAEAAANGQAAPATPTPGAPTTATPAPTPQPAATSATATTETPARSRSFIDATSEILFGPLRPTEAQTARADAPPNWPKTAEEPGMAEMIESIGKRESQSRIDAFTANAERSALAAASAMKDLVEGPGRDIVSRINSAARTEDGNVEKVLSEMRPDGRYAGLRQEFESSLKQNDALATAVDRVVNRLNDYGEDRAKLDAAYRRFERNPKEYEAKFQPVEETLAKAAQAFPGTEPGTSMIENLGEKIREALRQAIATIRQVLHLAPGSASQSQQDNSPGMGM
ncbi:MAG: DUF3991 domain-containing protein [Acidiphilium sp.]|nr:DUF3991 domain-containing protein [Acidiphilium sp.]MDD4937049.1 DUF3991 domain-containing protein [Acidiphilium sp.]